MPFNQRVVVVLLQRWATLWRWRDRCVSSHRSAWTVTAYRPGTPATTPAASTTPSASSTRMPSMSYSRSQSKVRTWVHVCVAVITYSWQYKWERFFEKAINLLFVQTNHFSRTFFVTHLFSKVQHTGTLRTHESPFGNLDCKHFCLMICKASKCLLSFMNQTFST